MIWNEKSNPTYHKEVQGFKILIVLLGFVNLTQTQTWIEKNASLRSPVGKALGHFLIDS